MQKKPLILALLAGIALSGVAQAALQGRDLNGSPGSFEAVYDTDRDITWLADANYAKTSGYDTDGRMTWAAANAWAAGLVVGGYDDWRLPTALNPDGTGPCSGYNCTGSEMGHLFYSELGGVAGQDIATTHNANYNLFQNVQSPNYWSGEEYAPATGNAWYFNTGGNQGAYGKYDYFYALAVRPGDIAAVPIPAAAWLLGSGLLGLIGVARRQRGLSR